MKIFIIVIMVSHFFTSCSTTMNQAAYDKQSKTKMLVGLSNRGALQQDPFAVWFNKEYGVYAINKEAVQVINNDSENLSIKLFMGTWCGDSRREVPRIYRILDAADFDESRLTLINVDREKKSPDGEETGLNIHHVPTLILYKNSSEIGRVIESPIQSLEEDMAAIINGEKYTPNHSDFGAN
jgi:thiol-disulfide isomerase/thioredoxin